MNKSCPPPKGLGMEREQAELVKQAMANQHKQCRKMIMKRPPICSFEMKLCFTALFLCRGVPACIPTKKSVFSLSSVSLSFYSSSLACLSYQ